MKKSDNIRPVCVGRKGESMPLDEAKALAADIMSGRWTRSDTARIGEVTITTYHRTFINWLKYKIFGSANV